MEANAAVDGQFDNEGFPTRRSSRRPAGRDRGSPNEPFFGEDGFGSRRKAPPRESPATGEERRKARAENEQDEGEVRNV